MNLTEVVVRSTDTYDSLEEKVRIAAILGTLQARFTDFKFLSKEWKETTEREALLGVSMTGIYDGPDLTDQQLEMLKQVARETNIAMAAQLGINPAAAVTCVKPSGTASQLADCASGIHPRHSSYYIRRVRGDVKDPLTQFLIASGVPSEPCVYQPASTVVFSFPQKAPQDCLTRDGVTAISHLEKWLKYQKYWCEHKPSVTISVKENEWPSVGAWVWDNFEWISGVSFLPYAEHTYRQAPYEECNEDTYNKLVSEMPEINWYNLKLFEHEDTTKGSQTFACTGGVCEVVDIEG